MSVSSVADAVAASEDTSHLLNNVELILASPQDFSEDTPQQRIFPLLSTIRSRELDPPQEDRLAQLGVWCKHLEDACGAAFARDKITTHLSELESWEDWQWDFSLQVMQEKRFRTEEIEREITELPIEWLKRRVTGNNNPPPPTGWMLMVELCKREGMDPPAYLTMHITFSLLPPLATLHGLLHIYSVRFRVWEISLAFFALVTQLKSFVCIPTLSLSPFTSQEPSTSSVSLTTTEALAMTVEAGILLDRMIDLSAEHKSSPIPETWIDEFEQLERMVGILVQPEEHETPSPGDVSITSMRRESDEWVLGEESMSSIGTSELAMELEQDEKRVFGEEDDNYNEDEDREREGVEYHVIDELNGVEEHSPFLARIIAEMENFGIDDDDYVPSLPPIKSNGYTNGVTDAADDSETTEDDIACELFDSPLDEARYQDIVTPEISFHSDEQFERLDSGDDNQHSSPLHNARNHAEHTPEISLHSESFTTHFDTLDSDDEEERDIDGDELYSRIISAGESESDEEVNYFPPHRTSSPIYEDGELDYEDGEVEQGIDFEDETCEDSDSDTSPSSFNPHGRNDDSDSNTVINLSSSPPRPSHLSLNPFSPARPPRPSPLPEDLDATITLPKRPLPPSELHSSHLHSKVTQIAKVHPTIALIPQQASFKPSGRSEYAMYTLRPNTSQSICSRRSHSRQSSFDDSEPRKLTAGTTTLYVRVLSDRVMVRVGGGWVDLDQYLREYIGRRGDRRQSEEYEFLEVEGRRMVSSPIVGDGLRRSVSPFGSEDGGLAGFGGTRRMFVRRKVT
jgi:Growth-Arrest-Specific Protein 2 Domain